LTFLHLQFKKEHFNFFGKYDSDEKDFILSTKVSYESKLECILRYYKISTFFFKFIFHVTVSLLLYLSAKDGNTYEEIDLSSAETDSPIEENIIDLNKINIRKVFKLIKKNSKLNSIIPVIHPIVIKITSKYSFFFLKLVIFFY